MILPPLVFPGPSFKTYSPSAHAVNFGAVVKRRQELRRLTFCRPTKELEVGRGGIHLGTNFSVLNEMKQYEK